MIVLGIDPGGSTGWAVYDSELRRVTHCGEFPDHHHDIPASVGTIDVIVIERPKGRGPTFPQIVEEGITFGRLIAWAESKWERAYGMLRYEVKSALTTATLGEVTVKTKASVWEALVMIHGEGSGAKARTRKGVEVSPPGALGLVAGAHQRDAVAVAVAWLLNQGSA